MPSLTKLLIANRGEIAVRIARSAADLGITTVAVAPADDVSSGHVRGCDEFVELAGAGPAAYLDIDGVVAAAVETGCDSLHPGYGFLSEQDDLATACEAAGITFVGPSATALATLGDKVAARDLAIELGVPVPQGSLVGDVADAAELMERLGGPVMLKAVAGGGGRGMRSVASTADLAEAMERCASEAMAAFGDSRLYVEELIESARHVEVQVLGDHDGGIVIVGDRECSLQRRRQKIVEIAPAIGVSDAARSELIEASLQLASHTGYVGAGTFEFLVAADSRVRFIEANARLQVEHTVTEEVTGVDIVAAQLRIAGGESLADIGLVPGHPPVPQGVAIQARVVAERADHEGNMLPVGGSLQVFTPPSGPGVRVDTASRVGSAVSGRYDSLLAKVITHGVDWETARRRLVRALREFDIVGLDSSAPLTAALIDDPAVAGGDFTTTTAETILPKLVAELDTVDPLAILDATTSSQASAGLEVPEGLVGVVTPMLGTIVSLDVAVGDTVVEGVQLAVIEAMKMEHVVHAPTSGTITALSGAPGDAIEDGHVLAVVLPGEVDTDAAAIADEVDLDHVRPDLAEVVERHDVGLDERRPAAVERRRSQGRRTARENIADLLDDGSFVEYGALVLAPQRRRRSLQELIEKTPGDGLVGGIGTIGSDRFDDARVAVMTYDYTVLAGTQGGQNHRKKDRLFELAERWNLPVVVFAEGGGGRPGDTDGMGVAGLDCLAFWYFARLSGRAPLVGINTGYCFAGNAALLGMCDVIISTRNANLGMGGPAMIEGGGLGVFHPSEVGPVDDQWDNGVIDILVDDDAEAVEVAQRYLSYFLGNVDEWETHDQRQLRHVIPENRLRMYDVREAIDLMCDVGSVLELRAGFGPGMVTALARVEGRAVGVVANDPSHLAGAIDSDGADKASRFMQLCDAFGLPVVFLCDTPGIMVGPEAEKSGTVRHASRMFVAGASMEVPFCTIVLRKGYGLGAQAMAGGSFKAPIFTVSWPTGEFGGMGLEGAVKLGYRNELEAIDDPAERQAAYEKRVAHMYEIGKALNFASVFEIDDVIDPAETRRWITGAFDAAGPGSVGRQMWNRRSMVDTW